MRGGTVARRLLVSGAPTGSTITVRCGAGAAARASLRTQFRKRCPARAKTYTVDARGTRSVVSFLNRVTKVRGRRTAVVTQLRPRTSLTVIVSAPGLIGKAVTFTMRARKRPTVIESCTPPGSAVPQATC
jgi:hypothetical protein